MSLRSKFFLVLVVAEKIKNHLKSAAQRVNTHTRYYKTNFHIALTRLVKAIEKKLKEKKMKKEKCSKQCSERKNFKQGFTLLELLVVVIIIGILAAIALPQYQVAVGKARFSELKTLTKTFQQAAQRYYMINNTYSGINGHINQVLDIELPGENNCLIWDDTSVDMIRCCKTIFSQNMCFYMKRESGQPYTCVAFTTDTTDRVNRLCQNDTGKTKEQAIPGDGYYAYTY